MLTIDKFKKGDILYYDNEFISGNIYVYDIIDKYEDEIFSDKNMFDNVFGISEFDSYFMVILSDNNYTHYDIIKIFKK